MVSQFKVKAKNDAATFVHILIILGEMWELSGPIKKMPNFDVESHELSIVITE